jgi:O-antigen/teichoic acid export membrane protein
MAGLLGLQRQVEACGLVAVFGTVRGLGAVWLVSVVPDIRAFFAWHIAASLVHTVVMRFSLQRHVGVGGHPARFSPALLRSVWSFAGGMSLITALGLVMVQADKLILSRVVPLETFGLYMLAWTVAAGLSRIAAPLVAAFGPHFTTLVSRGHEEVLARQLQIASQLTATIVLPPAALLVLVPAPILELWMGSAAGAARAAPMLTLLTPGVTLLACSYPALSVLYSRRQITPVVAVNIVLTVTLLPLLIVAVSRYGALGAAGCWVLYGAGMYGAYEILAVRGTATDILFSVLRDFVAPACASLVVAALAMHWSAYVQARLEYAALIGVALLVGWAAALLACRDLFKVVGSQLRWNSIGTRWSA